MENNFKPKKCPECGSENINVDKAKYIEEMQPVIYFESDAIRYYCLDCRHKWKVKV